MAEIIFYNNNTGIEVEPGIGMNYFRVGGYEDGVRLDYHRLQKKMMLAIEMFIQRTPCEDLDQAPTAQRWIEVDPPDLDVEGLSKAYIDTEVLAYSDLEMDLTASIRIGKNYTLVDFGTVKADQTKLHNKAVGQVFNVAAGHNSFDEKINFVLGTNAGTPTGLLTVKLWALDGSDLPLTELASVDITPNPGGINTAEFLSVNLPKSTKHAFTIQDDGTNDLANAFRIERSNQQIYTAGDYIDDLGGWAADNTLDLHGSFERR